MSNSSSERTLILLFFIMSFIIYRLIVYKYSNKTQCSCIRSEFLRKSSHLASFFPLVILNEVKDLVNIHKYILTSFGNWQKNS